MRKSSMKNMRKSVTPKTTTPTTTTTTTTTTSTTKKVLLDALFYTTITALGVGLTSLCMYGYKKYMKKSEQRESDMTSMTPTTILTIESPNNDITIESLPTTDMIPSAPEEN